jgi:hypothetical protein
VNLDVAGAEVADEDADAKAVLRPVSRYTEMLQELEDDKKKIDPTREVLVSLIGGVDSDGSVTYQQALDDPQFQADFGIGPGCESEAGRAVPPVRMREFAEAFKVGDTQNMFSICDSDYSQALDAIAKEIARQVEPACMPACVADSDPTTPETLDPTCSVTQNVPRGDGEFDEITLPACLADGALPEGADACYETRVGDAMHMDCIEAGFNLEFVIVRRDGVAVPAGTGVSAKCELSQSKAVDCPDLF